DANDHALLVVTRGDYSFVGENFVRGAVPDRLTLHQGQLPLELRDLDLDEPLRLPPELSRADAKVFRVIGPAGLDPAQPLDLALRITRSKGMIYPERASRDFTLRYRLPADYVQAPSSDNKSWRSIWVGRGWELALIAVALALLSVALARQSWLAANERRLARLRTTYLAFTLVFIGWYAQGQLSIVNLTALLQALIAKRSLDFFLYDPVSLVLWAFVAATLVIWGRGTFCGWLCPFGALQELVSQVAQRLGIARIKLHRRLDARLKLAKYAVLAVILATAVISEPWTDRVLEFEPFKTAITLAFVRSWPFVLWAGGVVLLSAFVYKGYCRYLCPLGAWLALLGRLRLLRWIPRRAECGTPCQTCRHRCEYQAIRPNGAIVYEECLQCLDCVGIHDDERRCAPLIARRHEGHKVFPIRPLPAAVSAAAQPAQGAAT
ncbi:MAG TPA: 4Fe-4S binding protein, partial [Methylibium sp.]